MATQSVPVSATSFKRPSTAALAAAILKAARDSEYPDEDWKCSNCQQTFPATVRPRIPVHAYPGEYLCDHGSPCYHPEYVAKLKADAAAVVAASASAAAAASPTLPPSKEVEKDGGGDSPAASDNEPNSPEFNPPSPSYSPNSPSYTPIDPNAEATEIANATKHAATSCRARAFLRSKQQPTSDVKSASAAAAQPASDVKSAGDPRLTPGTTHEDVDDDNGITHDVTWTVDHLRRVVDAFCSFCTKNNHWICTATDGMVHPALRSTEAAPVDDSEPESEDEDDESLPIAKPVLASTKRKAGSESAAAAAAPASASASAAASLADSKDGAQPSQKKAKHDSGSWSTAEDNWFILLVCQNHTIPTVAKAAKLRWDTISKRMHTDIKASHDAKSCELRWAHWYPRLIPHKISYAIREWSIYFEHQLITAVYETGAEDLSEIDWNKLYLEWSSDELATRFAQLQSRLDSKLSFDACINQLYDSMQKQLRDSMIPDHEMRPL